MADGITGVRIRVRRARDGAILYDSGLGVENVSELLIDTDMSPAAATGSFVEQYVVEAISYAAGASWAGPTPLVGRQTLVALGLHR